MSEKLDGNLFPIPHFYRTVQLSIHELSAYAWKIDNANISGRYFRPNADTRRAKEHYANFRAWTEVSNLRNYFSRSSKGVSYWRKFLQSSHSYLSINSYIYWWMFLAFVTIETRLNPLIIIRVCMFWMHQWEDWVLSPFSFLEIAQTEYANFAPFFVALSRNRNQSVNLLSTAI